MKRLITAILYPIRSLGLCVTLMTMTVVGLAVVAAIGLAVLLVVLALCAGCGFLFSIFFAGFPLSIIGKAIAGAEEEKPRPGKKSHTPAGNPISE